MRLFSKPLVATPRNELRDIRGGENTSQSNLVQLTPVRFIRCGVPIARLMGDVALLVAGLRDVSIRETGTRHKRWFFPPQSRRWANDGSASQGHG